MNSVTSDHHLQIAEEQKESLIKRRNHILDEKWPILLDCLVIRDEFANRLSGIRGQLDKLTKESIPLLEKLTSHDYVEQSIITPYRNQSEALKRQLQENRLKRQKMIIDKSFALLESEISLDSCLRIVSTLKQQRDFLESPEKLLKRFLEVRSKFVDGIIESQLSESLDDVKLVETMVSIMNGAVLDVISQYKAAFTDLAYLSRFINIKLEWFIKSISVLVTNASNTLILASYWNQLVLLNASYSTIGASFLTFVLPIFTKRAHTILSNFASNNHRRIQSKLDNPPKPKPPHSKYSGKDICPSEELLKYPTLVLIVNSFVEIFEQVRIFAIPQMKKVVADVIDDHMVSWRDSLHDRKEFKELLESQILPFINNVQVILFPPTITDSCE